MTDKKDDNKKTDDGLAALARKTAERLDRVVKRLEKQFGIDIDGDGKVGAAKSAVLALLCIGICVGVALAGSRTIDVVEEGTGVKGVTFTTDDDGTVDVDIIGDLTVTGAITGTGAFSGTGNITSSSSTEGLHTRQIARAVYDVSVEGGTTGAVTSLGVTLPDNAIIYDGYIDVTTAVLPLTSTVAIQVNTGDDIFAASTNLQAAGQYAIVPDGTAGNIVKTTNSLAISTLLGVGNVTQGVYTVVLEYDVLAN